MSTSLLLPNKFKKIGWFLLIPSFLIGLSRMFIQYDPKCFDGKILSIFPGFQSNKYFTIIDVNFTVTIIGLIFITGSLLICFSKEKNEDEFISKIRLTSLLWAVLVNYILLLIAFIVVYDTAFLVVMMYNMFTIFIIFIIRFHYILFKNSKGLSNAE